MKYYIIILISIICCCCFLPSITLLIFPNLNIFNNDASQQSQDKTKSSIQMQSKNNSSQRNQSNNNASIQMQSKNNASIQMQAKNNATITIKVLSSDELLQSNALPDYSMNETNYMNYHNIMWNGNHSLNINISKNNLPLSKSFVTYWYYSSNYGGKITYINVNGSIDVPVITNQNTANVTKITIDINGKLVTDVIPISSINS
jgi:hypothetical protein